MNREMKNNRHRMKSTYSYRVQPSRVLQTPWFPSLLVSTVSRIFGNANPPGTSLSPSTSTSRRGTGRRQRAIRFLDCNSILHRFVHIASMQWYRIAVSHTEIQGQQPSR